MEEKLRKIEQLGVEIVELTNQGADDDAAELFEEMDELKDELIKVNPTEEMIEQLIAVYGWDFEFFKVLLKQSRVSSLWTAKDRFGKTANDYLEVMYLPELQVWVKEANPFMVKQLRKVLPLLP